MRETIKALLLGLLQGITEWLPVSSTGHMLLFNTFFPMDVSEEFLSLFLVVIQLFSVFAVVLYYRRRLFPPMRGKTKAEKKKYVHLCRNILIGILPAAVAGFFLDDLIERVCYRPEIIASALILFGVIFLFLDKKSKKPLYTSAEDLSAGSSFLVGIFQTMALIPGVSRSGATMVGGIQAGATRETAAEFSFFLSIPVMIGASGLRAVKYFLTGDRLTTQEIFLLAVGGITAFLVSLVTVRFLLDFVKKHGFFAFGVYRILLGFLVFILFLLM